MLPKSVRLHLRSHADLFKTGKRYRGKFLQVVYRVVAEREQLLENTAGENSRGAVIVPKTVLAKATQRNLLKRQLGVLLNPFLEKYPGLELAIIARTTARQATMSQLGTELEMIFHTITHA